MVREGEVAPLVPPAAGRAAGRDGAQPDLRRSRLLSGLRAPRARTRLRRLPRRPGLRAARRRASASPPGWRKAGRARWPGWRRRFARRADPRALWPEARSIVMLAINYGPAEDPLRRRAGRDRGAISVYARHRDYHDVIKGRLKHARPLARSRRRRRRSQSLRRHRAGDGKAARGGGGSGLAGQAHQSGQPRIRLLAVPRRDLRQFRTCADAAETDHCGSCRACLDACPTNAFPAPYQLDARRCISYLTIEHPGPDPARIPRRDRQPHLRLRRLPRGLPLEQIRAVGARGETRGAGRPGAPPLAELAALDDAGFRACSPAAPIKRIGHARFLRNVMIAVGNSGDAALLPAVRALRASSPLARGAAVWALGTAAPRRRSARLRRGGWRGRRMRI